MRSAKKKKSAMLEVFPIIFSYRTRMRDIYLNHKTNSFCPDSIRRRPVHCLAGVTLRGVVCINKKKSNHAHMLTLTLRHEHTRSSPHEHIQFCGGKKIVQNGRFYITNWCDHFLFPNSLPYHSLVSFSHHRCAMCTELVFVSIIRVREWKSICTTIG